MKKIKQLLTFVCVVACSQTAIAQQGGDSTILPSYASPIANTVPSFNLTPVTPTGAISTFLNSKLSAYTAYDFSYSDLNSYLENNSYALEFNLNTPTGNTFLSLERRDLRSANYLETETQANGSTVIAFARDTFPDTTFVLRTVKGIADKNESLIARFAIHNDDLSGYIWNAQTNHVLYYTSLQDFIKANGSTLVTSENYLLVFDLGAIIGDPTETCGALARTTDEDPPEDEGLFEPCSPRFLEIAAEGDKPWCDLYGVKAESKIIEKLFLVEGIYTHNFNISFVVTNINLLKSNGTLYNTNDAIDMLDALGTNWNANHTSTHRDMTILFTARHLDDGILGIAQPYTLCDYNSSYQISSNHSKMTLICTHEMAHIFGSLHDDEHYGVSTCSGTDVPIMCSHAIASGPYFYFSPYSKSIILSSIETHAACLGGYSSGTPINKVIKSWSNANNQQWIASWHLSDGDAKAVGNFDGLDNDEEIFFASPNREWVGIMNFSCDKGTDWRHLWGNSGNRQFGTWVRNYGDRFMGGDFDGNGKSDLFSISGSSAWAALQEYNPTTWSWVHKWGNSGTGWIDSWHLGPQDSYVIADFDGDSKDELLCTNPNGWSMLIRFNWVAIGSGGYYTPQTIWSNSGSGWVGGVQVGNTQRWLRGKFATLAKDELLTISNTWVTTQRFDGTNWQWIWSQYGSSTFAGMAILPLAGYSQTSTGNVDNDAKDEFVNITVQWCNTIDFDGTNFVQNWNNSGTHFINDWNLNENNEHFLIKAASTSGKQIFGIRSQSNGKKKSRVWEPNLAAMYRFNAPTQNFKITDEKMMQGGDESKIKVYPNPSNDIVNIEVGSDVKSATVIITDLMGNKVRSQIINSSNKSISLKGLASGAYILKAEIPNQPVFFSKIMINGQ